MRKFYILCLGLAWLGMATAAWAVTLDIGSQRELMVDNYLIDYFQGGAELELHEPTKREVVLTHENPWEGSGCGYYTILEDTDRLRMYYTCAQQPVTGTENVPTHPLYAGYAESTDGIHWTKPNLGLFEYEGSTANNIIWAGVGAHDFTPFKDTNPNCPADAKYKAVAAGYPDNSLIAFKSADGINWSPMENGPITTEGAFDSQNLAFWDEERGEYRAYFRDFRDGARDIKTCTSPDFVNWSDPVWLEYPGAPTEQLYTNQIEPYYRAPQLFIGFPTRYTERGWSPTMNELPDSEARDVRYNYSPRFGTAITDGLFMTSRDGETFNRWGEAFIRPGIEQDGNWNYGDGYQAWGLIETPSDQVGAPNELSLYVGEDQWFETCCLRRYTLRIDGFVSVNAPRSGGEMVTKPFTFEGEELELNFATSAAGSVYVEIQDEFGNPIPGYSLADSDEIFGDTLSRMVTWNGSGNVEALADTPIRLRFVMSDADLYSLKFRESAKPDRPDDVVGGPVLSGGTTPYAWYRADVGVTPYNDDASRVAWWQDQSGNSRHIEAFGDPQITDHGNDGRQTITLDGVDDQLIGDATEWGEAAPGTVFAVWRRSADATGTNYVYDADLDQQRQFLSLNVDGETIETGGGEFVPSSTWINHYTTDVADPGADQWFVTSVSSTTGTTDTLRINGEEIFVGDLLSGGMSGLRIGGFVLDRNYFEGDIAELIVFESDLSATEREAIEVALMSRWGIGVTPSIPGDANGDRKVDGSDVTILAGNWQAGVGSTGPSTVTWAMGDFNGDGKVDGSDVTILAGNWQYGVTSVASVPEPSTILLLISVIVSLAVRWRMRL